MNRLTSLSLVTLTSLCLATALAGDETRPPPVAPRQGERAPIGSLTFADLEGRPRALARAMSDARWVVVHVFDTGSMDLLPGTKEQSRSDARRAARSGGSLSPARAPDSWSLDDHFEQAHGRYAHDKDFRWIGIPAWDFNERSLERERHARERGDALPKAEAITGSRKNVLELHLKRREPYSALLQSPSATTLSRLGVRAVPAILVFDARGELLLSWQSLKDGDSTNLLLRKLITLTSKREAAKRAAIDGE